MVAQGRRRRRTLGRRRLKRSRATLRKRKGRSTPNCMIGGMLTPTRQIYCDTYRNFMLMAAYLGWRCDQDVFPARMRASQPEEAVCSTLERMEQLAGLAQPSEYSIKFSIGKGNLPPVVVTWRAYVFDIVDKVYKGRIIYESKSNTDCYIEALTYNEFKLLTRCAYEYCESGTSVKTLAEEITYRMLGKDSNPDFSRIFHTYGICYALRRSELRDEPWLRTWAGIFMGSGDSDAALQLSADNSLRGTEDFNQLREQAKRMQEKISKREIAVSAVASAGRIAWSFVPGAGAIKELLSPAGKITSLTASGISYVKAKLGESLPVYVEVCQQVATEVGIEERVDERVGDAVSHSEDRLARKLVNRIIYGRKSADTGDNVRLEFVPFPITMVDGELRQIGNEMKSLLSAKARDLFLRRSCYGKGTADIAASQPLSSVVASIDAGSGNSMLDTVTAVQAGLDSIEQSKVSDLERRQAQLSNEIARAKTELAKMYAVGRQSELLSNLSDLMTRIQALMPLYRRPAVALESMSRAYAKRKLDDQTKRQIGLLAKKGSTQEIMDLFADTDKTLDQRAQGQILKVFEHALSEAQCGPGGATETELSLLLTGIEESLRDLQQRGRDGSVVEDTFSGADPGDTVLSSPASLEDRLRRFYKSVGKRVDSAELERTAEKYRNNEAELKSKLNTSRKYTPEQLAMI